MGDDISGLEGDLRSNGISVESLSEDETVELSYLTAFPGDEVSHQEMGRACNVFIDWADDGDWEPRPVEVTVLRTTGDVQGTWRIDPEWVTGLNEYRLTETEFSTRVLNTVTER